MHVSLLRLNIVITVRMSLEREKTVKELREALKDVLLPEHDDLFLLRWLRARNFVVHDAEQMFRAHLQWRKQMDVDSLLNSWQPPEVLTKYFPGGLCGHDKEGCPIWIEPIGLADVRGIVRSSKANDVFRFKIMHCEQIELAFRKQTLKLNKPIHGLTIILDLDKYGLKHLWRPALENYTRVLAMYADNYPENLKKCYVIRAPRIFPVAYTIMKPFLSEDTKRKVHVLGSNWKEQLLKDIDSDQLPVYWGGTATDSDGDIYCKSKVCIGGEVPHRYYLSSSSVTDTSTFQSLFVDRHSTKTVEVSIPIVGSMLRWQFLTDHHNVGFSVERKLLPPSELAGGKHNSEIIVPLQKVNSHIVPEDGCITCDKAGTYVLSFNNSYSWMRGKKILYHVEVIVPDTLTDFAKTAVIDDTLT